MKMFKSKKIITKKELINKVLKSLRKATNEAESNAPEDDLNNGYYGDVLAEADYLLDLHSSNVQKWIQSEPNYYIPLKDYINHTELLSDTLEIGVY